MPVWQRGGNESGIQPRQDPNAPVLRCAHGRHHPESLAQRELLPPQGRSTPEPAQQHPQSKVGDSPDAWHSLVVPKPSLAVTGLQLEPRCFSAPFTLSSAHLLQLMQCHGHEQRAPSTARPINTAQLIPRLHAESSASTGLASPDREPPLWGLPGDSQHSCHHQEHLSVAAPSHQNPPSHQNHGGEPEAPRQHRTPSGGAAPAAGTERGTHPRCWW